MEMMSQGIREAGAGRVGYKASPETSELGTVGKRKPGRRGGAREGISGQRHSKCKGPELRKSLASSRGPAWPQFRSKETHRPFFSAEVPGEGDSAFCGGVWGGGQLSLLRSED